MFTNFRQAMTWLHSWMGLVLGGLLGAVCIATGMVIAAVGMLVVNRVLPADMAGKGD